MSDAVCDPKKENHTISFGYCLKDIVQKKSMVAETAINLRLLWQENPVPMSNISECVVPYSSRYITRNIYYGVLMRFHTSCLFFVYEGFM